MSLYFIHGGLIPDFIENIGGNKSNFYEINYYVRKWLLGLIADENVKHIVHNNPHTIFWDRILGSIPPNTNVEDNHYCKEYLEKVLDIFNLKGMIIGHTPQIFKHNEGINSTCDEKLWRVDIGGSEAFSEFDQIDSNNRKPQVLNIYKKDNKI